MAHYFLLLHLLLLLLSAAQIHCATWGGFVDSVGVNSATGLVTVSGWACDGTTTTQYNVQIYLDGVLYNTSPYFITSALASGSRCDLPAAGVCPDCNR